MTNPPSPNMQAGPPQKVQRPTSPHLTIYRPQITSVLSIFHRASGVVLTAGLALVVAWVLALAGGPETFTMFQTCAQSFWGKLFLTGFAAAFFYHLAAGIRHLLWDAGWGFKLKQVTATGWMVLGFAAFATAHVALKIWGYS